MHVHSHHVNVYIHAHSTFMNTIEILGTYLKTNKVTTGISLFMKT